MIGSDHVTGTGHILNKELGIPWNMLPHVGDDEASPQVIEVAGRRSDDNPDGFSLIEGSLGVRVVAPQQQAEERKDNSFHMHLHWSSGAHSYLRYTDQVKLDRHRRRRGP